MSRQAERLSEGDVDFAVIAFMVVVFPSVYMLVHMTQWPQGDLIVFDRRVNDILVKCTPHRVCDIGGGVFVLVSPCTGPRPRRGAVRAALLVAQRRAGTSSRVDDKRRGPSPQRLSSTSGPENNGMPFVNSSGSETGLYGILRSLWIL